MFNFFSKSKKCKELHQRQQEVRSFLEDCKAAYPIEFQGVLSTGLSVCQYYASMAMQGLLSSMLEIKPEKISAKAFEIADEMLKYGD